MPLHHLLSRWALVIVGLWTGGGFFILTHFGSGWERSLEKSVARVATHFVESFSPAGRGHDGSRAGPVEPRDVAIRIRPATYCRRQHGHRVPGESDQRPRSGFS